MFILGVKVQKGDSQVEIYAENIVTNAGVSNTFLRMLPKEVATKSSKYSVDTPPLNVPWTWIGNKVHDIHDVQDMYKGKKLVFRIPW